MTIFRRVKDAVTGRAEADNPAAQVVSEPRVPSPPDLNIGLLKELMVLAPAEVPKLLETLKNGLAPDADQFTRYQAAEAAVDVIYPKYKFSEFGRIFLEDEDFLAFYRRFMDPGNWHSLDRKYTLNEMLKLVSHLEGDIAECGAYKGFSAHMMCRGVQGSEAQVHLFDSFEGLSEPDVLDGDYWQEGSLKVSEAQLHKTLAGFDNYRVYRGWIPERFNEVAERTFRFVHIDVDLYRPTLDSLSFFYPRLQASGIILLDDYGFASCPGAKKAADELFAGKPEQIAMLPTGQAFIIKQ